MKALFIGGTGLISSACSDLALERGHELFILNRSQSGKYPLPAGAQYLQADVHGNEARSAAPGQQQAEEGRRAGAGCRWPTARWARPATVCRPSTPSWTH